MNEYRRENIVQTGADRLLTDAADLISSKKIGILTNHTGRLRNGQHIIDAVVESGRGTVTALFGPEHGIAGATADGEEISHGVHPVYRIPVFSLYGAAQKPTKEMLSGIDILLCDIQDVGARFYTFISTIALTLEAAAEQNIPIVVLDRPNPIRGLSFDGPVREESLKDFVAWMPIPITHGMTVGELARMWNEEGQLLNGVQARLDVVTMTGWNRSLWYDETGLPWIAPSPNMQRLETAIIYPGLCLMEGTSVSEGRGTLSAFELIGAPWMNADKVIEHIEKDRQPGVRFTPEEFVPKRIPGVASEPKYEGMRCQGIRIHMVDRNTVQPVRLGVSLLSAIQTIHPHDVEFRHPRFDVLAGTDRVRKGLMEGVPPHRISSDWDEGLRKFGAVRSKYLLYP